MYTPTPGLPKLPNAAAVASARIEVLEAANKILALLDADGGAEAPAEEIEKDIAGQVEKAKALERDVECGICLDPIQLAVRRARAHLRCPPLELLLMLPIARTQVTTPCLHRFCKSCIEKWLRAGNNDCPECRGHIKTRRALRRDETFDDFVAETTSILQMN